jgi:hypothetical protein
MALFDNGFKIGTGLAIGLGALILAPAIAPAVAAVLRPLAKASIKGGILLFEKAQELIAEARESVEDLAAEAHAEIVQEREQGSSQVSGAVDDANTY